MLAAAARLSLAQPADPCMEYLKNPAPQGYRAARAHLDSILSINSGDRKALLYSALVDRAQLSEQLDGLYALRDSLEPGQLFGLANLMLSSDDCGRAVELYERLNAASPKWSCPWRHKGQALHRLGRMGEAEQALLKAVETRPTHYDAWVWLARVQKEMGKDREALKSIKKAFENKGKDVEDPEEEIEAGEDVKLLEEILVLNGVKPGKLAAERDRIASPAGKGGVRE